MKAQLVAIVAGCLVTLAICSSSTYLYDLTTDPTESTNVVDDDDYEESVDYLKDRVTAWQSMLVEPDDEDTDVTSIMYEAWDDCNCVTPWIENYYEPKELSAVYNVESAPHIIFVLVDDWGYNDFGLRSTYLNWTTPHIDNLARNGILLENYFTHDSCTPSRGALLTGRVSARLGLWDDEESGAELPLSEFTIAQELKTAGYRTHMRGKWHLGMSSLARTPTYRGFDSFYGYYNGFVDYYTKSFGSYLDLHDGTELVTDESELDSSYHNAYLMQKKVEEVLEDHALNYNDQPLFLYYALQLTHFPLEAPSVYTDRCDSLSSNDKLFCGMNLMLDEVISNLTCKLTEYGYSDNMVMIVASDNGGEDTISGNSVPFRGHKFDVTRGGVSANAFVYSSMVPESRRGAVYTGQMHVTDWLPTLMHLATNGQWNGSYVGNVIDGVNMWDSIIDDSESPRAEIVHYMDDTGSFSIQYNMLKYENISPADYDEVDDSVFPAYPGADSEGDFICDVDALISSSPRGATYDRPVNGVGDGPNLDNLDMPMDMNVISSYDDYGPLLIIVCIVGLLFTFNLDAKKKNKPIVAEAEVIGDIQSNGVMQAFVVSNDVCINNENSDADNSTATNAKQPNYGSLEDAPSAVVVVKS